MSNDKLLNILNS